MRIHQAIESLKQAKPINVLWGPGCAPGRDENDFIWALICLADLIRTGRVARVLTPQLNRTLLGAISTDRQTPVTYRKPLPELGAGAVPAIYEVGAIDDSKTAEWIRRGAATGPWIALGFDAEDSLAEILHGASFEHGLYWPGYQAPGRPLPAGAHFVPGFNADSFLAYLVGGFGEFPPPSVLGPAVRKNDPAETLRAWREDGFEKKRQSVRDGSQKKVGELFKQAAAARADEYDSLMEQAWSEFDLSMRFQECFDSSAAAMWRRLAARRSPREAAALFRRLRKWQDGYWEAKPDAEQRAFAIAGINGDHARFHTGPEAGALFAQADQAMAAAAPPVTAATLVFHATHADLLAKWAIQETGGGSAAIFERARKLFRKLIESHGQRSAYLYPNYVYALQDRAKVVSPEEAAGLLAEAREQAERYLKGNPTDCDRWWTRAKAALGEGDADQAARAFERFLVLKPGEAKYVFPKWAEGLGDLGKIDEAEDKFAKAESVAPPTAHLYAKWAGALVRARRWDDAARRAAQAEELQAGSGSYALAQIAAAKGDREGVRRWLGRAAEHGLIPSLAELLRDPAMKEYRDDVAAVF